MDFLNEVTDPSGTVTKLVESSSNDSRHQNMTWKSYNIQDTSSYAVSWKYFHKREIASHKTVFYGPRLLELKKNKQQQQKPCWHRFRIRFMTRIRGQNIVLIMMLVYAMSSTGVDRPWVRFMVKNDTVMSVFIDGFLDLKHTDELPDVWETDWYMDSRGWYHGHISQRYYELIIQNFVKLHVALT